MWRRVFIKNRRYAQTIPVIRCARGHVATRGDRTAEQWIAAGANAQCDEAPAADAELLQPEARVIRDHGASWCSTNHRRERR